MNPEKPNDESRPIVVEKPRHCPYVKQDYCRNPMHGIDDACYKCLADKVLKARTQGGRMAAQFLKVKQHAKKGA